MLKDHFSCHGLIVEFISFLILWDTGHVAFFVIWVYFVNLRNTVFWWVCFQFSYRTCWQSWLLIFTFLHGCSRLLLPVVHLSPCVLVFTQWQVCLHSWYQENFSIESKRDPWHANCGCFFYWKKLYMSNLPISKANPYLRKSFLLDRLSQLVVGSDVVDGVCFVLNMFYVRSFQLALPVKLFP